MTAYARVYAALDWERRRKNGEREGQRERERKKKKRGRAAESHLLGHLHNLGYQPTGPSLFSSPDLFPHRRRMSVLLSSSRQRRRRILSLLPEREDLARAHEDGRFRVYKESEEPPVRRLCVYIYIPAAVLSDDTRVFTIVSDPGQRNFIAAQASYRHLLPLSHPSCPLPAIFERLNCYRFDFWRLSKTRHLDGSRQIWPRSRMCIL